jgi:hypothetical protein
VHTLRWTRTLPLMALASLLLATILGGVLPALAAAQGSPPAPQAAQAGAIRVEDDSAAVTFGAQVRELRFRLHARSAETINRATLLYVVDDSQVENSAALLFRPGTEVLSEYVWRVDTALSPGSTVRYRWQVETASGARLETPAKTTTYADSRFPWKDLQGDGVTVYWHGGDAEVAPALLEEVRTTVAKLRADYGLSLDKPLRVYAYTRQEDYASALGIPARGSGNGATRGDDRIFVFTEAGPAALQNARTAVRGHVVNALFAQKTDNPYGPAPVWLADGFRLYLGGASLSEGNFNGLRQRAEANQLIGLRTLTDRRPSTEEAENLGMVQSLSVVKFMFDTYGAEKVSAVLAAFKEGATTDDALKTGLGVTLEQLESRWKGAVVNGTANRPARRPESAEGVPSGLAGTVFGPTIQSWRGVFGSYAPAAVYATSAFIGLGIIAVIAGTFISIVRRARQETES